MEDIQEKMSTVLQFASELDTNSGKLENIPSDVKQQIEHMSNTVKGIILQVQKSGIKSINPEDYQDEINQSLFTMLKTLYFADVDSVQFQSDQMQKLESLSSEMAEKFTPIRVMPMVNYSEKQINDFFSGIRPPNMDFNSLFDIYTSLIINLHQKFKENSYVSNILQVLYNIVEQNRSLMGMIKHIKIMQKNALDEKGVRGGAGGVQIVTIFSILSLFVFLVVIIGINVAKLFIKPVSGIFTEKDMKSKDVNDFILGLSYSLGFVISILSVGFVTVGGTRTLMSKISDSKTSVPTEILKGILNLGLIRESDFYVLRSNTPAEAQDSIFYFFRKIVMENNLESSLVKNWRNLEIIVADKGVGFTNQTMANMGGMINGKLGNDDILDRDIREIRFVVDRDKLMSEDSAELQAIIDTLHNNSAPLMGPLHMDQLRDNLKYTTGTGCQSSAHPGSKKTSYANLSSIKSLVSISSLEQKNIR